MFIWKSRALTRAERATRYAPIVLIALLCALAIADKRIFKGNSHEWLVAYALVIMLLQAISMTLLQRRARRLILNGRVFVCPRCGYDLDGLPDSGTCPECGDTYTPESLRGKWAMTYDLKDLITRTPSTPSPPPPHTPPASPTPPPGASTN